MKFYFAGPSAEWPMIRTWIQGAIDHGHFVTYDWTIDVEAYGHGEKKVTPPHVLKRAAETDLAAACDCDVLVLFLIEGIYGAMLEAGAALAMGKEVWLVTGTAAVRYSIFFEHPLCETIDRKELRRRITST